VGYSTEDSHVYGMLFNEHGKWKYDVCLDYTGQTQAEYEHWDLKREAVKALVRATEKGISGVTMKTVPEGWMLVVPEPHALHACPLMTRGGFVGLGDALYGDQRGREAERASSVPAGVPYRELTDAEAAAEDATWD